MPVLNAKTKWQCYGDDLTIDSYEERDDKLNIHQNLARNVSMPDTFFSENQRRLEAREVSSESDEDFSAYQDSTSEYNDAGFLGMLTKANDLLHKKSLNDIIIDTLSGTHSSKKRHSYHPVVPAFNLTPEERRLDAKQLQKHLLMERMKFESANIIDAWDPQEERQQPNYHPYHPQYHHQESHQQQRHAHANQQNQQQRQIPRIFNLWASRKEADRQQQQQDFYEYQQYQQHKQRLSADRQKLKFQHHEEHEIVSAPRKSKVWALRRESEQHKQQQLQGEEEERLRLQGLQRQQQLQKQQEQHQEHHTKPSILERIKNKNRKARPHQLPKRYDIECDASLSSSINSHTQNEKHKDQRLYNVDSYSESSRVSMGERQLPPNQVGVEADGRVHQYEKDDYEETRDDRSNHSRDSNHRKNRTAVGTEDRNFNSRIKKVAENHVGRYDENLKQVEVLIPIKQDVLNGLGDEDSITISFTKDDIPSLARSQTKDSTSRKRSKIKGTISLPRNQKKDTKSPSLDRYLIAQQSNHKNKKQSNDLGKVVPQTQSHAESEADDKSIVSAISSFVQKMIPLTQSHDGEMKQTKQETEENKVSSSSPFTVPHDSESNQPKDKLKDTVSSTSGLTPHNSETKQQKNQTQGNLSSTATSPASKKGESKQRKHKTNEKDNKIPPKTAKKSETKHRKHKKKDKDHSLPPLAPKKNSETKHSKQKTKDTTSPSSMTPPLPPSKSESKQSKSKKKDKQSKKKTKEYKISSSSSFPALHSESETKRTKGNKTKDDNKISSSSSFPVVSNDNETKKSKSKKTTKDDSRISSSSSFPLVVPKNDNDAKKSKSKKTSKDDNKISSSSSFPVVPNDKETKKSKSKKTTKSDSKISSSSSFPLVLANERGPEMRQQPEEIPTEIIESRQSGSLLDTMDDEDTIPESKSNIIDRFLPQDIKEFSTSGDGELQQDLNLAWIKAQEDLNFSWIKSKDSGSTAESDETTSMMSMVSEDSNGTVFSFFTQAIQSVNSFFEETVRETSAFFYEEHHNTKQRLGL